jgi:formyltetrahydrofolate synthetase
VLLAWRGPRFLVDTHQLINIDRFICTLQAKIEAIACGTYGASGVSYSAEAEAAIAKFTAMGFDRLPICMAKTQYSFSHDATLKGE